jgi:hypothetical protein
MLATVGVALLPTLPADPPAKPEPPVINFLIVGGDALLTGEVSNANTEALHCLGYRPDSSDGGQWTTTVAFEDARLSAVGCARLRRHPGLSEFNV